MIAPITNKRRVEAYIRGVQSGEIVVGKVVRAAIDRHLSDLEKSTDDDYLYEFNERKAEDFCLFFPAVLKHSKGEWAGQPFQLGDWQIFILWCIFGWVRKSDGMRRFRKAYVSVARKNGKSTVAGGISLLLLTLDGEAGAEIFVAATKREQAKIVHSEAKRMVRQSPSLMNQCTVNQGSIWIDKTNSFFQPTSSDRPLDGPNPHGVIFDELHAWREQHRDFYETMTTGGASRRQPLEVTITTAGNDKSLLWRETDLYVRNVVTGVFSDDTVFGFICEIDQDDDPFDEAVWPKANPNLGISVKLEYLRNQARDAQSTPTRRNAFIRYHCNRVVSSVEDAITKELWDEAAGEMSDWSEADYIGGGFDIGGRDDLAAYGLCARFALDPEADPPVWRYEIKARSYIDQDAKRDLTQQPWQQWIHNEQLIQSENTIAQLRNEFHDECEQLGAGEFAYDNWNAKQCAAELEQQGMEAVKMPQGYAHYNEVVREFLKALADGRIRHDGKDEVLRWAALNLAIKSYNQQWMPDKEHSKDKIDPIVAVLMAFRMAMFAESGAGWSFADGAKW